VNIVGAAAAAAENMAENSMNPDKKTKFGNSSCFSSNSNGFIECIMHCL